MRGQLLGKLRVIPENAAQFAALAVRKVKDGDGIDLDYSIRSLRHLDNILGRFHAEDCKVEQVTVTLFCFGCYVGEVFVRNNRGAAWVSLGEDETESSLDSGLVVELRSGTIVNPIGKVEKRLVNGEVDSLAYFYTALLRMESTPQ